MRAKRETNAAEPRPSDSSLTAPIGSGGFLFSEAYMLCSGIFSPVWLGSLRLNSCFVAQGRFSPLGANVGLVYVRFPNSK